ncbi:MAG TPA: hypothetical protein VHF26_19770, partial [Trebonia sp.]|nr:hypothetical protein [Trebonia sp.]
MPAAPDPAPAGTVTSGRSAQRWEELLTSLAVIVPDRGGLVAVDGPPGQAGPFAARLAGRLAAHGRSTVVTAGDAVSPDVTIHLRTGAAGAAPEGQRERGRRADVIVDLHDPAWPVIRRVSPGLAPRDTWYLTET